jgi:hypothetical protein
MALGPAQPPIQWVPGAFSQGIKRPECEADHSPPSIAEVKNAWSYTSTPQYVFIASCFVKHRDNFTFTQKQRVKQAHYMEIFKQLLGAVFRKSKVLNFVPTIGFSIMTMLQVTQCSLSKRFSPKKRLL